MTTTARNEAAERLLKEVYLRTPWRGRALEIITEALAVERRATVERITAAYLASQVPDGSEVFYKGIDAASANLRRILDEEAAR